MSTPKREDEERSTKNGLPSTKSEATGESAIRNSGPRPTNIRKLSHRSSGRSSGSSHRRSGSSDVKSSRPPHKRLDNSEPMQSRSSRLNRSSSRKQTSSRSLSRHDSSSRRSSSERAQNRSSHNRRRSGDRRNSADGASNSPSRATRKRSSSGRLSRSSHAKLGSSERRSKSSSLRSPSDSHHSQSNNKPRRHHSTDSMLSLGAMGVLTEDEDFSDEDSFAGEETESKPRLSSQSFQRKEGGAISSMLYGKDGDAKAKAKAKASRESSQQEIKPGVEHIRENGSTPVNTLYGNDADAKAKAKTSKESGESARVPGVLEVPSNSTRTISTLYGKDADAKAKAKASRGSGESTSKPGVEAVVDNSTHTPISTLYGNDVDAKAKAKTCRGSGESTCKPGVETVVDNSTLTLISTLYGTDLDAKAKAKSSRGGSEYASNPGVDTGLNSSTHTSISISMLYGTDSDAKAKAKVARGGPVFASNPRVENVALPATLVEHDEINSEEPVARRLSTTSTGSELGSTTDPALKSAIDMGNSSEAMDNLRIPNDPEAMPTKHKNGNDEAPEKSKRKKRIACFLLFLLLLGGGVAAWFFLSKNDNNSEDSQINTTSADIQAPTGAPTSTTVATVAPSDEGSMTMSPTSPPFLADLLFQPPNESNCDAISKNETIAGRDEMDDAVFGLGLEVVLSEDRTMTEQLVVELLDAIQEKTLPSLAGCNIPVDEFVDDWRFVIFDAYVTGSVQSEETCKDEALATQNCHSMSIQLDLFLKGRVRFLDIIDLISDEKENISNHLGLSDPFSIVKLRKRIDNLTPTASPSSMPSDAPSFAPSESPTVQDSAFPTPLPTATPTKTVSGVPTRAPSLIPTSVPSSVPTTALPSVNPSFLPTKVPSESPSTPPSEIPSDTPSLRPSKALSETPSVTPSITSSLIPTSAASLRPTVRPSRSPTNVPSVSPTASPAPSMDPTSTPTLKPSTIPSRLPSQTPSSQPTITSFHWAACGARNGCSSEPASLQNSNNNRMGGSPSGLEIAVRCCSDISLPGFEQNDASCPYADSEVDGVCYNSVTYHEADALCSSAGARLCTAIEISSNCASNTGCGHNNRFAWTSTADIQPSTTAYWTVCGREERCPIPALAQDASYDRIGGVTGWEAIATRCCSDAELPGYRKREGGSVPYESCPFAETEIDGVCHENTSYDEAFNLCAGAGARLCTKAELENGCAGGTGCNFDDNMIWSSDQYYP
ncbi:unnamed protein product [Cylindrotheca closterium]|uniref:Uncharacterized protein n=1 Tax=Cylindrotheca closterium TaxID=2856 RepID=A0AAD2FTY4_9STRA|nr:unnamed protein product [Cylindrotheca closterium]